MPTALAGNLAVYYELDGSAGSPLVLVSGLGANVDMWDVELRAALAQRHQCLVFDNRGTGRTAKPAGPYSIAQFARDGVAFLDALGLDRVHLVGASMGGLIAQEMALQAPERLQSLTLCCTFAGFEHLTPPTPEVLRVLLDKGEMDPAEGTRQAWPIMFQPEFILRHRDWLETKLVREIRYPCPPDVFQWHFEAAANWEVGDRLLGLRVPTLVMTGECDALIPPENSRTLLTLVPHATFRSYPDAGHGFLSEARDAVVADILAHTASWEPATA